MRKITVLSFILFLVTINTYSSELIFGGSASYSAGWFSGKDWNNFVDNYYEKNNVTSGFSLGLFLDINFSDHFSLQPEVNYLLTSGKTTVSEYVYSFGDYITAELQEITQFITFPVLAKYKILFNNSKWSFFGGPQLSFLLGDIKERQTLSADGYLPDISDSSFKADNLFYLGAVAGTGYEFRLRRNIFFTDLRYTHIFTSFFTDSDMFLNNIEFKVGFGTKI